jgi:hypothetical protein
LKLKHKNLLLVAEQDPPLFLHRYIINTPYLLSFAEMASILDLVTSYNQNDATDVLDQHNAALAQLEISASSDETPRDPQQSQPAHKNVEIPELTIPNHLPLHLPTENTVPYLDTRLEALPPETKQQIFGHILGFQNVVDVTIPRARVAGSDCISPKCSTT